jgi:hypothetical protein
MDKVFAGIVGAVLCMAVIAFVASGEDQTIAEKCDYAGKVKLNGKVYTCAPATPAKGESKNGQ